MAQRPRVSLTTTVLCLILDQALCLALYLVLCLVFIHPAVPGSGYIGSGHSGSGYSGSGHVLSGSIGTRAISDSDSHAQPRTNTGVGLYRSEAAVLMIQSRLNETNEENAAPQSKIQQMEQFR